MKVANASIFREIDAKNVREMMRCLNAQVRKFQASGEIFDFEEGIGTLGIILSGRGLIERVDGSGRRTVLEYYQPNDLFSDVAMGRREGSLIAETPVEALFLDFAALIHPCTHACSRHLTLIENVFRLLDERAERLNRRLEILSCRTIREKLLTLFEYTTHGNLRRAYSLPLNLTEMADYIASDRSAMMRELKKMKEESLIDLKEGKITLLKRPS